MINIFSPINTLGFGTHGKNMIKAINKTQKVCLTPIGQPDTNVMTGQYGKVLTDSMNNRLNYSYDDPSIFIFHESHCNQFSGNKKYAFSIFETDKISPINLRMLKHSNLTGILATTSYHKDVLVNHGIDSDMIKIVHEGIDPDIFNTSNQDKLIETNNFTFLTVGKSEKRKNTEKIVKSFINICAYKDVSLICHTFNPFIPTQPGQISLQQFIPFDIAPFGFKVVDQQDTHVKLSNGVASIYLTLGNIKDEDMYKLYNSANIGIQVSSGEAWDLPLQEMMACGVPSIVSLCSGHSEYADAFDLFPELVIEPSGIEVANDGMWFNGTQGNWSEIKQSDIQDKIELVIEDQKNYTNKIEGLSQHMIDNYSWDVAAKMLLGNI